jgi:arsenate reductase
MHGQFLPQSHGRRIFARGSGRYTGYSKRRFEAGGHVHLLAIKVMHEVGIDISQHRSKHLNEFLKTDVETVITVCGNADQACPLFPGQVNRHHWEFCDPAKAEGSKEEIVIVFRQVRDEIKRVFEAYAAGRNDHRFS